MFGCFRTLPIDGAGGRAGGFWRELPVTALAADVEVGFVKVEDLGAMGLVSDRLTGCDGLAVSLRVASSSVAGVCVLECRVSSIAHRPAVNTGR